MAQTDPITHPSVAHHVPRAQSGGLARLREALNELGLPISSHISHAALHTPRPSLRSCTQLSPSRGAHQPPSPPNLPLTSHICFLHSTPLNLSHPYFYSHTYC